MTDLELTVLEYDGIVELDTPIAQELGFISDLFDGYLWLHPGEIYISFIESVKPGQGNLSRLLDRCWELGLTIKVPTPFPHMEAILKHKGFKHTTEWVEAANAPCEVWVK